MISNRGVVAVIPARGGSKTIKNKNIKRLYGKPLIAWTIETALSVKAVDRVIVSTDHSKIAQIASDYGAEVMMRPDHLSQDHSLPIDVIRYCISQLNQQGDRFGFMLYLEPTCPLRSAEDVQKSLELLASESTRFDSVATFCEAALHPDRAWKLIDESPVPYIPGAIPWLPRQKLPEAHQLNGAVYGFRIDSIDADSISPLNGKIGYLVLPKERSIDIDDEIDFLMAELLMERKWKHEKNDGSHIT